MKNTCIMSIENYENNTWNWHNSTQSDKTRKTTWPQNCVKGPEKTLKLPSIYHTQLCTSHCAALPSPLWVTQGILTDFLPPTQGTLTDNFSPSQYPWGILNIAYNIKPVTPPTGSDRTFLTQSGDSDRPFLFLSESPGSARRGGVELDIDWCITLCLFSYFVPFLEIILCTWWVHLYHMISEVFNFIM